MKQDVPALTEEVARFIRGTSLATIPGEVIEKAKKSVVDTFGVMLAGSKSEVAAPLMRYVDQASAKGDVPIIGTSCASTPELAALVNGTFAHALDFDDVLSMMAAHPSSVALAASLANVGEMRISGERLLEAHVVGVEVGAKVGLGITVEHFARGFHGQGTLCLFTALASLAKVRAIDIKTIQTAFGIGSSMASGLRRNLGTMTKPLHAGWAARNGVIAINLAQYGLSAAQDALEGEAGFFAAYGGIASDPMITSNGLGKPWVICNPGLALKRFPCCYASHRGMDGVLALRKKLEFTADSLMNLDCRYPPGGTVPVKNFPHPKNGLEGKFSLQYSLAAGVLDGGYTLATFTDAAVQRPEIAPLLLKISIKEHSHCAGNDPFLEMRSPGSRGFVEVEVQMKNGVKDMVRVNDPPGHPSRELGWDEIECKFMDCAEHACIDHKKAINAFERLRDLEKCDDVGEIVGLLRPN